jgi:hypothetical protein
MTAENDGRETLLQELEALTEKQTAGELQQKLAQHVNDIINTDFDKLLQLLYRMDIDETKLRTVLLGQPDRNAGEMIAELMIERQLQKVKSRQQSSRRDNDIDENEKW